MRIYIASGDFLTRNTERRVEVGVRVDDPSIAKSCAAFSICSCGIPSTHGNAARRHLRKVKPAPGQFPVDSQMAMFGYFKDGFEMEARKPSLSRLPKSLQKRLLPNGRRKATSLRPSPLRSVAESVWTRQPRQKIKGASKDENRRCNSKLFLRPCQGMLYLTKPTLHGWRKDVREYEESDDGLHVGNTIPTEAPRNCISPGRKNRAAELHLPER